MYKYPGIPAIPRKEKNNREKETENVSETDF